MLKYLDGEAGYSPSMSDMDLRDYPKRCVDNAAINPVPIVVGKEQDLDRETTQHWYDDIPDSEHVRFFKAADWNATLLGPLQQWSTALRLYTHQLLADSRPAIIYWGSHKVAIYNEVFVPLAGKTHPTLMGMRFEDAFAEIWENIKPVFDGAETSKRAVDVVELPLMVERSGFTEETYFTGNFNPLRGESGRVEGFYNALTEVTRQKLTDRRRAMLNLLSVPTQLYTIETIGAHIIEVLATNPLDIPFALLYQVDEDSSPDASLLNLRGSIGVPPQHSLSLQQVMLRSEEGLMPLLRSAQADVVTVSPARECEGVQWAGYGEPSKCISALSLSNAGRLLGFLVVGSNPRRPIDHDHEQFVRDMAAQLSAVLAFSISTDEALRRQQRLVSQLADREKQIRYMAEHLEIGMEHLDLDGHVIWANEHYYTLIGHTPPTIDRKHLPFKAEVYEEDQPLIHQAWNRTVGGERLHTIELRMKRKFVPPSGPPVHATVLLSAFPYVEDGKIKSVMACMTDVSRLKWAESWQARAAQEAQEAKRQQSEFTDAISHEVRNPLSAIFQLADSIVLSLDEARAPSLSMHDCLQILDENVEAAKTILICANHQKRIVDDVLTLSKMDFMVMSLSPTAVQPADLAYGALKMLDADLSGASIKLAPVSDPSLDTLHVSWVLCDTLRVTQILINLLSNAIKFTKREEHRSITMTYGASVADPRDSLPQDITWAASKNKHQDVTFGEQWGNGESIYLTYLITDTGPGMDEDELKRLFNRFEQASPKTSIKYGGSGLGLFISQSLCEKQNGAIGVSSAQGKGSTFAFYIKARRKLESMAPSQKELEDISSARLTEENLEKTEVLMATLALPDRKVESPVNVLAGGYRILLVEDNLVNQRILRKQLTKAGCVVHIANHGVEALDVLRTTSCWKGMADTGHHLDVILMDWEMPIMDGLTCSKKIRALERAGDLVNHVEIIAVTANVRQEQVERAKAAGVDDVLPKPFIISDLLQKIKLRLGR